MTFMGEEGEKARHNCATAAVAAAAAAAAAAILLHPMHAICRALLKCTFHAPDRFSAIGRVLSALPHAVNRASELSPISATGGNRPFFGRRQVEFTFRSHARREYAWRTHYHTACACSRAYTARHLKCRRSIEEPLNSVIILLRRAFDITWLRFIQAEK